MRGVSQCPPAPFIWFTWIIFHFFFLHIYIVLKLCTEPLEARPVPTKVQHSTSIQGALSQAKLIINSSSLMNDSLEDQIARITIFFVFLALDFVSCILLKGHRCFK